jgi:hypothetical protein
MANFTTASPTIDAAISSTATNGMMQRMYYFRTGATVTAATTTSGGVSLLRSPQRIQMPSSNGSGVSGFIATNVWGFTGASSTGMFFGLEYELGSLAVSTNTFTDGVAMPTKTVRGASITTAASLVFAVATVAVTATTPTLTITYTDQDGNTSNTATLTLPTSPVINTGFYVTPHLASGDTGIRDVTNISISTGTAGTIKVYGVLPLMISNNPNNPFSTVLNCMNAPLVPYLIEPSEYIGTYRFGAVGAAEMFYGYNLTPETT